MRNIRLLGFLLTAVALVLAFEATAWAQVPVSPEGRSVLEAIRNSQPAFLVRAEVNKTTRDYREGDSLSIRVASEVDAYVYVVYQRADGELFLVFPNRFQPNRRVPARQAVEIPARDDFFRWRVGPPFGKEMVKVIAAKEPIRELAGLESGEERYAAVSQKRLKGAELELGKTQPEDWAEHDVAIHTYGRDQAPGLTEARRYGVFFGVSDHLFNTEAEQLSKGRNKLNLPCAHRDARVLADLLREVGQLSDLRVYTNERATRQQLEQTIDQWLPVVSRPGDTVFIFFSGHGAKIPEQKDAPCREAFLIPYDFVPGGVYRLLRDTFERGDPVHGRFPEWRSVVENAGPMADEALIHHTAVSDTLFARWVQRLDGRQVIVILDICHAGGFAEAGRQDAEAGKAIAARFLDNTLPRLKAIGQQDCAVWAACGSLQYAQVRVEHDLSVMTYYLLEHVRQALGPVELAQSHQYCKARMKEYFMRVNAARQAAGQPPMTEHEPRLFNSCTRPVYLKP